MNPRKIKSYRVCGNVNKNGVLITDKALIEKLNKLAQPLVQDGIMLLAPSTSGCTVASTGKHTWYLKAKCYYQCGSCKYYATSHENYGTPTCTSKGYCDCGGDSKPALGHSFTSSEKYCLRGCGATNPSYVAPVPAPSISSISFSNITYNSFRVNVSGSNISKYKYVVYKNSTGAQVENSGVVTSSYWTVTGTSGLESSTMYRVVVYAWNSIGDETSSSNYCMTDLAPKVEMPSPTITPIIGGFDITWTFKKGASLFRYTLIDTVTQQYHYGNNTASVEYIKVTGLVKGREYKIFAYFEGGPGYSDSDTFGPVWRTTLNYPQVDPPSLSCSPAITSVTITWSPPIGANELYISLGNATQAQAEITKTVSASSRSVTITGLYPNCKYNVYSYYKPLDGYLQSVTVSTSFTTSQKPTFYWSTTVTSQGAFNITADDWNKMCNTINTWRSIKNLSPYSFTTASRGNKLTADMFNQARIALSSMTSNIPNPAYTGQICYASEFKKFETAINGLTP